MSNQRWHMRRNCHTSDESDVLPLLSELDSRADFPDADENLRAQLRWRRVAATVLLQHAFDRLFEAVLAQTGAALIQVLPDLHAVHVVQLAVQVAIDPVQNLSTRRLMGGSAAHRPSSPVEEASETVLASPRSAA